MAIASKRARLAGGRRRHGAGEDFTVAGKAGVGYHSPLSRTRWARSFSSCWRARLRLVRCRPAPSVMMRWMMARTTGLRGRGARRVNWCVAMVVLLCWLGLGEYGDATQSRTGDVQSTPDLQTGALDRLAIAPKSGWHTSTESNREPSDLESGALPIELHPFAP